VSTITMIVLACAIMFQLPVIVYFLSKAGLITPDLLRTYRRHAIIGALVISAFITPPDPVSQLLVCLPLIILYQVSISISALVLRKKLKAEMAAIKTLDQ
jgi:sec-independent protein translocase protein TatC